MSKNDAKSDSKQDASIRRERIACLKKVVGKQFLKRIVQRRKLDKRISKKCPAYLMVWFTIAIWFFGNDSYTQVFRWLHRFSRHFTPTSSALTQARAKIGVPIMADIYREVVGCLCSNETPRAFYAGRRLVAVDGFVLNLPDSPENRRAFGRPQNGTSDGAFPQVRIVGFCEVGSHVFFNFLAKPIGCGEATMAKHVYKGLPENSLLLFDIGFCVSQLMMMVIDQNSDFLGRSKMNRRFRKDEVYGLLIAHFVIRKLAFEAAKKAGVSPRDISFTGTINVLRARLPEAPRSRHLIADWYASLLEEISLGVLEPRRNRMNPRVIKRPQSKWPRKRQKHRNLPPLEKKFDETIVLLT